MKQLKTLIRLQQRTLDQLRREQAQYEHIRDGFIREIEKLNDDLAQEFEAAHELIDLSGFFGDFSGSIKKKQQVLAAKVVQQEQRIQEIGIEISQQFSELKKYEIAYDNYLMREAKKLAMLEQKEMDEIGIRNAIYGES